MLNDSALVSAREAAEMLATVGLSRTSVRRALTAGVAGVPERLRGTLLYRRDAVAALLQEPLREDALPPPLHLGLFVARLRFGNAVNVRFQPHDPPAAVLDSVRGDWSMSWMTRLMLQLRPELDLGPMPFVATCGGIVVVEATVETAHQVAVGSPLSRLVLGPPGDWHEGVHLRVLRTPSGHPWTLLPRTHSGLWLPEGSIGPDPTDPADECGRRPAGLTREPTRMIDPG